MGKLKPSTLLALPTAGLSLIPGVNKAIDKGVEKVGNFVTGKDIKKPDTLNATSQDQINQAYQNTQGSIDQQQSFLNALQGQNALGNQSAVYNQLGGIASGTGPNLAQAQLNNTTQQNIANQAALMAGQRGAGQNAGMIARQAALRGGDLQQDAIGQAAALQAQQQMNALAQQGQMANQMANQLGQGQQQLAQSTLSQQQNLLGTANQYNQQQQATYQDAMNRRSGLISGIAGAVTKGASMAAAPGTAAMAHGGEVSGAQSELHKHFTTKMAHGGKVPVMVSPGEAYIEPEDTKKVAKGDLEPAKVIPGKAKVKGDSLKNDTVPTQLEAGGIVVPRTVVNSKNPEKEISKFVQAVLAKSKLKK